MFAKAVGLKDLEVWCPICCPARAGCSDAA